ncbi:unnamed protein product [Enterobius vermicularis]|uniref:Uncharacterized protein n=1 Tax=Enterobius vermicularis TaxID=51028 RepID=A0A0N4V6Z3_ENTVE|nr:unnamed protein product [Enterobius vermicularis]
MDVRKRRSCGKYLGGFKPPVSPTEPPKNHKQPICIASSHEETIFPYHAGQTQTEIISNLKEAFQQMLNICKEGLGITVLTKENIEQTLREKEDRTCCRKAKKEKTRHSRVPRAWMAINIRKKSNT